MNGFKDSLFVGAVPAEPSVADDMVGRYETELAGIYRLSGMSNFSNVSKNVSLALSVMK